MTYQNQEPPILQGVEVKENVDVEYRNRLIDESMDEINELNTIMHKVFNRYFLLQKPPVWSELNEMLRLNCFLMVNICGLCKLIDPERVDAIVAKSPKSEAETIGEIRNRIRLEDEIENAIEDADNIPASLLS